jgi:hypothetical protein
MIGCPPINTAFSPRKERAWVVISRLVNPVSVTIELSFRFFTTVGNSSFVILTGDVKKRRSVSLRHSAASSKIQPLSIAPMFLALMIAAPRSTPVMKMPGIFFFRASPSDTP